MESIIAHKQTQHMHESSQVQHWQAGWAVLTVAHGMPHVQVEMLLPRL
jgi:hypothetical protein